MAAQDCVLRALAIGALVPSAVPPLPKANRKRYLPSTRVPDAQTRTRRSHKRLRVRPVALKIPGRLPPLPDETGDSRAEGLRQALASGPLSLAPPNPEPYQHAGLAIRSVAHPRALCTSQDTV